jgi:ribosomal protein S18 acetylase RimI-like enzyme
VTEIVYTSELDRLAPAQLEGFFVGWPRRPSSERHLELLRGASHAVLAREGPGGRVVGFVTAISDGVLSAYVPLLEVLPELQGRGIGSELMRRLLADLADLYMVDLACDEELVPFYERAGFRRFGALMAIRRRDAPALDAR